MEVDLEIERVAGLINDSGYSRVCIQLPDGLKPRAGEIHDELSKKTSAEILIWSGSCFGGCDVPLGLETIDVDLLVQWGHSKYDNQI